MKVTKPAICRGHPSRRGFWAPAAKARQGEISDWSFGAEPLGSGHVGFTTVGLIPFPRAGRTNDLGRHFGGPFFDQLKTPG
jgi:hypothetical protein